MTFAKSDLVTILAALDEWDCALAQRERNLAAGAMALDGTWPMSPEDTEAQLKIVKARRANIANARSNII